MPIQFDKQKLKARIRQNRGQLGKGEAIQFDGSRGSQSCGSRSIW